MNISTESIRNQFPAIMQMEVNDQIYLDSAATTQVPSTVIQTLSDFYTTPQGNVHRSNHRPGRQTTTQFEQSRKQVAEYIGAEMPASIIWTSGTTEAINLISYSWAENHLAAGDEILLSELEHHANLIPWQQLAKRLGVILKWIPLNDQGLLNLDNAEKLFTDKVKLLAITQASNVTGIINDLKPIISLAKSKGVCVLVDGAQSIAHMPVNVSQLGCDFFTFSAHKLYGPKGIGVLYVAPQRHSEMSPWKTGGEMVQSVTKEKSTFQKMPLLLEAGTPNIAGVIGLGATINFLQQQDLANLWQQEHLLHNELIEALTKIEGVHILASTEPQQAKIPLISFTIAGLHHFDIASLLDEQHIYVRSGKHCAMPLMNKLSISGNIRVSLGLYNNKNDISTFIQKLNNAIELLKS